MWPTNLYQDTQGKSIVVSKSGVWKISTEQKNKFNFAKGLLVLLTFSKNHFLIFDVYNVFFYFTCYHWFLLSLHIYFFWEAISPTSRPYGASLSYYFWDSQHFHVDTWDYKLSSGLPSFGQLSFVFFYFNFNKNQGLLKFHSWIKENMEFMLVLISKLHFYWLAFIALGSVMYTTTRRENYPSILPRSGILLH